MEIHNLNNPSYCEAMGLSKVFKAYAEECSREDIMIVGFNAYSGYVYIVLESGINVCCCINQEVEYLVTDFETGEEHFFNSYEEAQNRLTDEI